MDNIALNYQEVIKCPRNIFEKSIQTQMNQGGNRRMILVVNFLVFLKIHIFALFFVIFDLEHDVEAMHSLCLPLKSPGNLFLKYK